MSIARHSGGRWPPDALGLLPPGTTWESAGNGPIAGPGAMEQLDRPSNQPARPAANTAPIVNLNDRSCAVLSASQAGTGAFSGRKKAFHFTRPRYRLPSAPGSMRCSKRIGPREPTLTRRRIIETSRRPTRDENLPLPSAAFSVHLGATEARRRRHEEPGPPKQCVRRASPPGRSSVRVAAYYLATIPRSESVPSLIADR
jgi:hypothetical protein